VTTKHFVRAAALASLFALVLPAGVASAGTAPAPARSQVVFPQCSEQAATGPTNTDVNAQAGDGRITVGLNTSGNITVFRYPTPGYYDQVKYFTTGADSNGVPGGELPNEGSFAGLLYTTEANSTQVTHLQWLKSPDLSDSKQWVTSQSYATDQVGARSFDTPIVTTTYSSPALGLSVTDTDLATEAPLSNPSAPAAYVRDYVVRRAAGSPVVSASLVYYEHFAAFGSRFRYFPVEDSCFQQFDDTQTAAYEASQRAIVQGWQGVDQANGKPSSVAFAFGFAGANPSSFEVGEDGSDPLAPPAGPADGYNELESSPHTLGDSSPHTLGDSSSATGQPTGALVTPVDFSQPAPEVRVVIGAGSDPAQALSALDGERKSSFGAETAAVDSYWSRWLGPAPMPDVPATFPGAARIVDVAQRSLITIRLAVDPNSGAIIASADTQGPYGEDWVRDGSFIDEALDQAGYTSMATKHELFEASAQTTATNPDVLRPPGNWPMNVYADGIPGGPIPYEIDETGFGAWTLWDHYGYLRAKSPAQATAYLREVFPAISRAADWLAACHDPVDNLECNANEDDNLTPTQTVHGAGPDLLGLRSAVSAAKALGMSATDPEVALWQKVGGELQSGIDALWSPGAGPGKAGEFGESSNVETGGTAPSLPNETALFSDGGWLLWPVAVDPLTSGDPELAHMRAEASDVLSAAVDSLEHQSTGGYEAKGLLGVCKALPDLSLGASERNSDLAALQGSVAMLAGDSTVPGTRGFATNTGLFAESWQVYDAGTAQSHVVPLNDIPHVWEHALYYMTALCAFGST